MLPAERSLTLINYCPHDVVIYETTSADSKKVAVFPASGRVLRLRDPAPVPLGHVLHGVTGVLIPVEGPSTHGVVECDGEEVRDGIIVSQLVGAALAANPNPDGRGKFFNVFVPSVRSETAVRNAAGTICGCTKLQMYV